MSNDPSTIPTMVTPDGRWRWEGDAWVPNAADPASEAVVAEPSKPGRPRKARGLGLKVTGGVLAVLIGGAIATASITDRAGTASESPDSGTSSLDSAGGTSEGQPVTGDEPDPDAGRPPTQPPALTSGDFEISRSDGTTVTGTLALSEVLWLADPRVSAWMDQHGVDELPCDADPTRDAVILGNVHLENATPAYSIEGFGIKLMGYPGGAVGTQVSSGSKCGGKVSNSDLSLKPVFNGTSWSVPIQIVVPDYYSPQHPDGQLPTDRTMSFAGYFDNIISPTGSQYRGDLFDVSEDLIWDVPLRIRG